MGQAAPKALTGGSPLRVTWPMSCTAAASGRPAAAGARRARGPAGRAGPVRHNPARQGPETVTAYTGGLGVQTKGSHDDPADVPKLPPALPERVGDNPHDLSLLCGGASADRLHRGRAWIPALRSRESASSPPNRRRDGAADTGRSAGRNVSDPHVRSLRDAARRTRGQLASYVRRDVEAVAPAAQRRADLAHSAANAAARLAAAEARRRIAPPQPAHEHDRRQGRERRAADRARQGGEQVDEGSSGEPDISSLLQGVLHGQDSDGVVGANQEMARETAGCTCRDCPVIRRDPSLAIPAASQAAWPATTRRSSAQPS